ncbi:MAG: hypothetical protein H6Q11_1202, partial [Acidobacteria bacterium]|nr:hypothetical protein [Acidobacteriota bacterium]
LVDGPGADTADGGAGWDSCQAETESHCDW